MTEHTPTPWRACEPAEELDTLTRIVSSDGIMLVHAHSYPKYSSKHPDADTRRANADFIVKAVNNHDALIEALQEITRIGGGLSRGIAAEVLRRVGCDEHVHTHPKDPPRN